jgi:hypothetical protein
VVPACSQSAASNCRKIVRGRPCIRAAERWRPATSSATAARGERGPGDLAFVGIEPFVAVTVELLDELHLVRAIKARRRTAVNGPCARVTKAVATTTALVITTAPRRRLEEIVDVIAFLMPGTGCPYRPTCAAY